MKYLLIAGLLTLTLISNAQFGDPDGITLNLEESVGGYTMFENFNQTFLVDNCGEIVNTWNVNNTQLHTKLTEDGKLIYIRDGRVLVKAWDDTLEEVIVHDQDDIRLVYEVIELPNKNLLCLAREEFTQSDFDDIGYQIDNDESPVLIDSVVELDRETGNVVWRWNLSDHVIQERDPSLPNFGSVADNPQLLDMDAVLKYDWTFSESFMINGFDYSVELDQIVLSVRKINEIVIIDHSTTTEEAAGSTGGKYGQGGDILYRWGNPQNYRQGDEDDHFLYYQHNPNWIHFGEHAGGIVMFNNGLSRPGNYSEIVIINPTITSDGFYIRDEGEAFGPVEPLQTVSEFTTDAGEIFSEYTGSAKVLSNGNIFMTEGDQAIFREFTPEGKLVWQYYVPSSGYIFRGVRYTADYPGLQGQDLTPQGTVEFPPSEFACNIFSSVEEVLTNSTISIIQEGSQVVINNPDQIDAKYEIYDYNGRQIIRGNTKAPIEQVGIQSLQTGLYIIQITDRETGRLLESSRLNCLTHQ